MHEALGPAVRDSSTLILGGPGTGKSSILAHLDRVAHQQNSSSKTSDVAENHFSLGGCSFLLGARHVCYGRHGPSLDELAFVDGLVAALKRTLPREFEHAWTRAKAAKRSDKTLDGSADAVLAAEVDPSAESSQRQSAEQEMQLLVRVLCEMSAPAADAPPVVVFVDSLDEVLHSPLRATTSSGSRHGIVGLLSLLVAQCPPWMRVLATSRPDPDVESLLSTCRTLNLGEAADAHDSVLAFARKFVVRRRIDAAYVETFYPSTEVFCAALAKQAEGVFLFAVTMLELMRLRKYDPRWKEARGSKMNSLWEAMFAQEYAQDLEAYRENVAPLLALMSVTLRPLTREELYACRVVEAQPCWHQTGAKFNLRFGIDTPGPSQYDFKYTFASALDRLSVFLLCLGDEGGEQHAPRRLVFYHSYIQEWLNNRSLRHEFVLSPAVEAAAHRSLALVGCGRELTTTSADELRASEDLTFAYALVHWARVPSWSTGTRTTLLADTKINAVLQEALTHAVKRELGGFTEMMAIAKSTAAVEWLFDSGSLERGQLALQLREDEWQFNLPLWICGNAGNHDALNVVLRSGVDIDWNLVKNKTGGTALWWTCLWGRQECMSLLLDKAGDRVDVNQANNDGVTPLYVACHQGNAECVKVLLDKAGDRVYVNEANKNGLTPLYIACNLGKAECVEVLLDKAGDRVDVNQADKNGNTPLYAACSLGMAECVEVLLDKAGDRVDVNQANKNGLTPLNIACNQGKAECVEVLLDKAGDRVDVNQADKDGVTPLYSACDQGKAECVEVLLDKAGDHVDVNQADTDGVTPLYIACSSGYTECVEVLLDKAGDRVDVNQAEKNAVRPLCIACSLGKAECVEALLDKAGDRVDVNQVQKDRATPLHIACDQGKAECVEVLLDKAGDRVDVNLADGYGNTPLDVVVQTGHWQCARMLLGHVGLSHSNILSAFNTLLRPTTNLVSAFNALLRPTTNASSPSTLAVLVSHPACTSKVVTSARKTLQKTLQKKRVPVLQDLARVLTAAHAPCLQDPATPPAWCAHCFAVPASLPVLCPTCHRAAYCSAAHQQADAAAHTPACSPCAVCAPPQQTKKK